MDRTSLRQLGVVTSPPTISTGTRPATEY